LASSKAKKKGSFVTFVPGDEADNRAAAVGQDGGLLEGAQAAPGKYRTREFLYLKVAAYLN
jgi:hypothetical protein